MIPFQRFTPTFSGAAFAASGGVSLKDVSIRAFVFDPDDSYAGYRIGSDGKTYRAAGNLLSWSVSPSNPDWVTPNGDASNYECRATLLSGTLSSGTTGSWLPLTSTRDWHVLRTFIGTNSASILVEIRPISGSVVASATISLSAEVST